ncbi:MAG: carboxypeptidase-like regulatory domain-containing protein [Saprospiraceae bacterium]
MKYLLSTTFLILSISAIAQISGTVINATTNQPIPYTNIWLQNQNTGTTADENGNFKFGELPDTTVLVFSALGYEYQIIKINELGQEVKLKPTIFELETVEISPPKLQQEFTTGKLKKRKVSFWYCSGKRPFRLGKVFHYKKEYEKTPFIKTIEFVSKAAEKKRKVLLHIYEIGEGNPKNWNILAQNIEYDIEKGRKVSKVDLSEHQVKISEMGVMIVIEWLIIDQNFYEFEATNRKTGKVSTYSHYEPCIGLLPTENLKKDTWTYIGKWTNKQFKVKKIKKYRNKYTELAMEITLSD